MESLTQKNKALYNSRIINTYLKLINRKYNYINVDELLAYANMEPYQVKDEGHWFTQDQINRFHEKLEKLTGNTNIAREAGRYVASPDSIGVIRQYVLGLVGPAKAYEIIGQYSRNLTKSTTFIAKKIRKNEVEITVTPVKGIREKPFQCENRMGSIEAVALAFNNKLPKIEHPECVFKGGSVCRYIVSWKKAASDLWKKARNFITLILLTVCITSIFYHPWMTLTAIFSTSGFVILFLTLIGLKIEQEEFKKAINYLHSSTDQLISQININYNHVLMINEIGYALSKQMNIDDILNKVVHILNNRLDYDRGLIYLCDLKRTELFFRAGYGYSKQQLIVLKNSSFHLNKSESKGVFVVCFKEQRPLLINDINEIQSTLTPHSLEFAKRLGTKSFICCPIIYEGKSLGILAVDNLHTKKPLLQSDINLLMGIAPEIGISIHNIQLLEEKERQFKSLLHVLAASIDARDPLTAGHSEKVTEYAVGICNELGMTKEYCEIIRIASLLHDYGKIGIKDSILKKPGKLNLKEYEEIKTHAEKTRSILDQIHFEGIYQKIPEIAASHHEKIDGSGYPHGLKSEEIPLGAKIIAVADFFEAITSQRLYRDAMPLDTAFRLLQKESGVHFDKKIVEGFIRYFNKTYPNKANGFLKVS